jgi:CHAT domain-containing protein
MNRATGAPDYVSAQQIGQVLTGRNLRVVILSACESSLPGAQPTTYSNVAQTLIKMGIPVVVANQASIKVPSMATFVGALYRELLQSGNIDIAMAEARLALSTELSVEWGVPTLHRLYGGSQVYQ